MIGILRIQNKVKLLISNNQPYSSIYVIKGLCGFIPLIAAKMISREKYPSGMECT
jgi:hypothetical protein